MATSTDPSVSTAPAERDTCAAEPIHIPGGIQPHGALLVFEPNDHRLLQASANATALLGVCAEPGKADPALTEIVRHAAEAPAAEAAGPGLVRLGDRRFRLALHPSPQGLLAEFEPETGSETEAFNTLYPHVRAFVDRIERAGDVTALCGIAAAEVRRLSGFHRVMVYRFGPQWHGTVMAEDGDGRLPSYLGLRFPASDIPAQARALYLRNRLRLIPDAGYRAVPMVPPTSPVDGQPLDMSAAQLRSVSPVHLEYMRNMGTAASMSISIVVAGALWGLVSCHHAEPRVLGPQLRNTCDFIGQILAMQIAAREEAALAADRLRLGALERELLARVSRASTIQSGLRESADTWLQLTAAQGAAVVMDGAVLATGVTPDLAAISGLADWLHQRPHEGPLVTDALPSLFPPAAAYADVASGLLAVPISARYAHYIMWFRPEVVQTVTWGGEPAKVTDADGRLHPRRSFASWREQVRGQSEPWRRAEQETATTFMNAVVAFVLKRAEERAELTEKLESSNRELEAFSYSVSHDLRAPFRHVVGYAQLLRERDEMFDDRARHYLDAIIQSASAAGQLVDDLLSFSQLGRSTLEMARIDMDKVVSEIRQSIEMDIGDRRIEWRLSGLPVAHGDAGLIRQVMANLLDNAIKYTRRRDPAVIEVSGESRGHETVYTVRDNGVGFDMAYVGKLFGVFQRLQRAEDFEGTGIGLALARRIIDRHGGWIAAEGELNHGATFRIGLPKAALEASA